MKIQKRMQSLFFVVAILSMMVLLGLFTKSVFANDLKVIDSNHPGSIIISYMDEEDSKLLPVGGADFTLYKVGMVDSKGNALSLFKEYPLSADMSRQDIEHLLTMVQQKIKNNSDEIRTYHCETTNKGYAQLTNIDLGIYLVEETKAADHYLKSEPFIVSIPFTENGSEWLYDVKAEPKSMPCNQLKIEKTVTGNAGETNRDFHFCVKLELNADYDDAFRAIDSAGNICVFRNGQMITLKNGQSFTIQNIPTGTHYQVIEEEANKEGYQTTMQNAEGVLTRGIDVTVSIINDRNTATIETNVNTPTYHSDIVQTGDEGMIQFFLIAFLVAAVIVLIIILCKKRYKRTTKFYAVGIAFLTSCMLLIQQIQYTHGNMLINDYMAEHQVEALMNIERVESEAGEDDESKEAVFEQFEETSDLEQSSSSSSRIENYGEERLDSEGSNTTSETSTTKDLSQGEDKKENKEQTKDTQEDIDYSGKILIHLSQGGNLVIHDESSDSYETYEINEDGILYCNDQPVINETTSAETNEEMSVDQSEEQSTEKNTETESNIESTEIVLTKLKAQATELVINANEDYVIGSFIHKEDDSVIDDGPGNGDLSKNVTMLIPYSESVTSIDVDFKVSSRMSDTEQAIIAEEEKQLAEGDMVLVSMLGLDSELIANELENQPETISEISNEGSEVITGESIVVSDKTLPTSVTVYNTGELIHYSRYGGSSSEVDLHHIYSTSDDPTRRTAYCVDPGAVSPVMNTGKRDLRISNVTNNNVYKVLYYGYGGPGDITGTLSGWSVQDKLMFTRLCAVYALSNQNEGYTFQKCSQTMINNTKALWNTIMKQDAPLKSMSFSPANQSLGIDKTISEDITFQSQGGNSVTVNVPEGVSLVNKTNANRSKTNGAATIHAGDVFYLESNQKDYTYNSGVVTGNRSAMLVFITDSLNNTAQRLVGWVPNELQAQFKIHWDGFSEIKKSVDHELNEIGEIQTWTIEAEIPNNVISSYEITDQLDERLDYVGNVTVETVVDSSETPYTGQSMIYDGIDWSPVFDPAYYAARYPDIRNAYGDDAQKMLEHFLTYGMKDNHIEGRKGFDVKYYQSCESNGDLFKAYGANNLYEYYKHFCKYGMKEGRESASLEEGTDYLVQYDDKERILTVEFGNSPDGEGNTIDKLTCMQNRKLIITFETKINAKAAAGEKIENISVSNVNNVKNTSNPAYVYPPERAYISLDTGGIGNGSIYILGIFLLINAFAGYAWYIFRKLDHS